MVESADLGGRAPEPALLCGFLDWNRGVVVNKVRDLPFEDAARAMTSSGVSPLGVIAHLAAVEIAWFEEKFAGLPIDPLWDEHGSFRLLDADSVESVVEEYESACDRARAVVDAARSLDELSVRPHEFYGEVSLRWILVHMIEETARHAGHLDVMREAIDGSVG